MAPYCQPRVHYRDFYSVHTRKLFKRKLHDARIRKKREAILQDIIRDYLRYGMLIHPINIYFFSSVEAVIILMFSVEDENAYYESLAEEVEMCNMEHQFENVNLS